MKILSANSLKSFACAIVDTIGLHEKKKDKDLSLLGLTGHSKNSEPFFCKVAYVNGKPYDFLNAQAANKNECGFPCGENCKMASESSKKSFSELLHKPACIEANDIRPFIEKYINCTKYSLYSDSYKVDLNPQRIYSFPVAVRNHPEECYLPLTNKSYNQKPYKPCNSPEVLVRQLMVHYKNARK